jgi:hypothetical protein
MATEQVVGQILACDLTSSSITGLRHCWSDCQMTDVLYCTSNYARVLQRDKHYSLARLGHAIALPPSHLSDLIVITVAPATPRPCRHPTRSCSCQLNLLCRYSCLPNLAGVCSTLPSLAAHRSHCTYVTPWSHMSVGCNRNKNLFDFFIYKIPHGLSMVLQIAYPTRV